MGISNNSPTMSYIHISGISVVWNNETYMVQDFATNKKYIYWNADFPHQLNASNVMPSRSAKQYLVIVNDNGMHTLVPPTSDDFSISFEGNSNQAIKDRIFGLYNKSDEFEKQFVAVEQDIDGIKSIVGTTEGTTEGTLIDRMSKVEQRADKIDLSVEQISKTYNDDKETNQLRENLNSSVIKLNSALGVLKNELTDYFKDNEISSEEQIKIKAQLGILKSEKTTLEGYVDTVKLIAENNNQTQDVVAIESAKKSLQIAHDNLHNNITNAVIDNIITPTENTIIIDSFAKYNLRINELKNTCDDIIILGVGGVITEELANISIKSNEIKLSVSKVESDFKNDMSLQKLELEGQIKDVNNALGSFEETVNTTFKDGIIDEAEKSLLQEKINLIDKEKVDIDLRYNSVIQDLNLSKEVKTELTSKYNEYCNNHNKLKERINSVISDNIINDAEKLEINTLFKTYSNALASFSALMNKAIENISFNASKYELEEAKKELNNSINGVKDSIEGIDKVLDGTFEDNILDEVERENIKQNLQNLSKEKLDIDKIYTNLYNNAYLLGQDKVNLKNSYDNYISKYNNVVKVSNDILEKEDLVNNVDKANMDSAIANHNETLALFHVQANKSIDIIAANRVNGAKNEINEDIESLKGDINGLNDYIDESFRDGVLSDAEKSAIKQNLKTLETNKSNIDKQYSTVYNNTSLIGSAKTELKSAYDNYVLKYNSLVTVINNILNKDDLLVESDSTAINNSFKEHNSAMSTYSEKINKAIDSIALKNIESAKNELSKEIGELEGSLVDLEDTMNGAFKDGILSESEKQSINQHLLTVSSKKTDIDKRYATLSSNAYLEGTAKTNLTTAYNNYIKAYNSLVTVINNILEKEGLIDSVDKNNLDNAFKEHNNKLGLYSTADLNALDYIATKKAQNESSKIDKKYADIILTPETGILSKVEHFNKQINGDGGISERLQIAESKITETAITNTVKKNFYTKDDINNKGYQTSSQVQQTVDGLKVKIEQSGGYNNLLNSQFRNGTSYWNTQIYGTATNNSITTWDDSNQYILPNTKAIVIRGTNVTDRYGVHQSVKVKGNTTYSIFALSAGHRNTKQVLTVRRADTGVHLLNIEVDPINAGKNISSWRKMKGTFTVPADITEITVCLYLKGNGTNNDAYAWFTNVTLTEGQLVEEWSPHPSEVYDGITTIDKDGVTVTSSNVKSKTSMTSRGFKITKTDTNEDVFKVNADGTLYMKGQITVTGGSVPTSNLSGTISSNQLNSTITNDISTAKNNASNAVSTANTAKSTADSAKTTATTANNTANTAKTTADSAKSTANSANNTANSVKSTVDSNSPNWSNAYNRVKEWASGAVTGTTYINGGMIAANTILANKIAIMDYTNYSQLNEKSASSWGFNYANETSGTLYTMNSISRDKYISDMHLCNGGETFRIKGNISTTCKGYLNSSSTSSTYLGTAIGIYCYNGSGSSVGIVYSKRVTATSTGAETIIDSTVTIPSTARKFRIFVQTEGTSNFSGTIKLRNIQVFKCQSGELIVDGSITANKIASNAITAGMITSGTLDSSKVSIKSTTTKKIVIANDNYCVYDGTETDVNRKIFMGFRTNTSYNVPSVMLGYNGINPSVDGAVTSGGTYTTYSHYPNINNPESVNMSYGALAFKYGSSYSQFSTINMYQSGEVDVKSGSHINFRPNLRNRDNAAFSIRDSEIVSNVSFKAKTSLIVADGKINMYYGMLYFPQVGAWKNGTNISIGECRLQGLTSLHLTDSTSSDSATLFCKNTNFSSVSSINDISPIRLSEVSALDKIMALNIGETNEGMRIIDDSSTYDRNLSNLNLDDVNPNSSNSDIVNIIIDEEKGTVIRNIDVFTTISTLCKAVQELKQENEELKEIINTII